MHIGWRGWIGIRAIGRLVAAAAALVVAVGGDGVAQAQPVRPVVLTLPAPTGLDPIGVVDLHMVDRSRPSPWIHNGFRELMVSIWCPAADTGQTRLEPWLPHAVQAFEQDTLAAAGASKRWTLAPTHGHVDAPADVEYGPRPVLLYSPGAGVSRDLGTVQAEDLASHGYVVVAIDHPGDTSIVEFPHGRIQYQTPALRELKEPALIGLVNRRLLPIRVADVRFVLDQLAAIARGRDPDVDGHVLPANMNRLLDLARVGMYGHSLGGATAIEVMHDDGRVRAVVNFDGSLFGSEPLENLAGPVMLVRSVHPPDLSWQQFWMHDRGPKLQLPIAGTRHMSFTDWQIIAPQLAASGLITHEQATAWAGTVDPARSLTLQRDFLRLFLGATVGWSN